jgi:Tol biopolymer transport system component
VVTPIPVAKPPFIPGLEDVVPQPFRIILREGNAVWTIDSNGNDRRLLLDTENRANLYLGHHLMQGVEGPRIRWGSVSPDGTTLALVVTDLQEVEYKGQPFSWQIYLFDIQTDGFHFLVEGREPVWSPEGAHIAYIGSNSGLWVVDVESGEVKELFAVKEGYWVSNLAWSPDSRRIAFIHEVAPHGDMPGILVINTDGSGEPVLLTPQALWSPSGTAWTSDGRRILLTFATDEPTGQWFHNLWVSDTESDDLTQLTTDTDVASFALHPLSGDWIVLAGKLPYENESSQPYDLWLASMEGNRVLRLTHDPLSSGEPQWSPDGTQVVFRRENEGIWILNLTDGSLKQIYSGLADFVITR